MNRLSKTQSMHALASFLITVLMTFVAPSSFAIENAESFSTYTFVVEYGSLKQRALRGDRRALFQLANMHYTPPEGSGIAQSYRSAFDLYVHAAMRGHRTSQHNVGAMYLNGDFVAQNTVEAVAWFTLAARHGDPAGARRKKEYETYLTEIGKEKAQKRAQYLMKTFSDMQRRRVFDAKLIGLVISPLE